MLRATSVLVLLLLSSLSVIPPAPPAPLILHPLPALHPPSPIHRSPAQRRVPAYPLTLLVAPMAIRSELDLLPFL